MITFMPDFTLTVQMGPALAATLVVLGTIIGAILFWSWCDKTGKLDAEYKHVKWWSAAAAVYFFSMGVLVVTTFQNSVELIIP